MLTGHFEPTPDTTEQIYNLLLQVSRYEYYEHPKSHFGVSPAPLRLDFRPFGLLVYLARQTGRG